jgi:hypothetical protein
MFFFSTIASCDLHHCPLLPFLQVVIFFEQTIWDEQNQHESSWEYPINLIILNLITFWDKKILATFFDYRQYITTFVDFQDPHVNHHSQQKNPQQMEFWWCGFQNTI